ncbi:hypothetical protein K3495_g8560 [Podosphaera aphanis]|nr:hypothetical protein K3495_g8560 [Podosphaera aphanis]
MRHDSPKQHKPASPLPTPSNNVPSRPPVTVSNQPRNWTATVASPPAAVPLAPARPTVNRPSRIAGQTPTANFKGPKAIFRLSDDAPILRADPTAVKAALIQIVPGLKDGIISVSRNSSGFSITFATEDSLKLATVNSDTIKASLSGSLHQVGDRIGYVVKRIPRTIWTPVSNLVTTTLDDVRNIAQAQTGVAPSNTHWSQHQGTHDPFHTAVIFFPKEVSTFRIVDSAPSRHYIPNPKGKLIQPSEKVVTELRKSNRNKLRKTRRADAAATAGAAASATSEHDSNVGSTLPAEASAIPPQSTPSFSQNRFTPLENASSGSMEIDLQGRATINFPDPTLYEQ